VTRESQVKSGAKSQSPTTKVGLLVTAVGQLTTQIVLGFIGLAVPNKSDSKSIGQGLLLVSR